MLFQFSEVFKIIYDGLNKYKFKNAEFNHEKSQSRRVLFALLFDGLFDGDNANEPTIRRYCSGDSAVPYEILEFGSQEIVQEVLVENIQEYIFPVLKDVEYTVILVRNLLWNAENVLRTKMDSLVVSVVCDTDEEKAAFLARVVYYAVEYGLPSKTDKARMCKVECINNYIPSPCPYFRGRDREIDALHQVLCETGKVFVHGIPGIGKSELIKAYMKKHNDDFVNIFYLHFSGCLKDDISAIQFKKNLLSPLVGDWYKQNRDTLKILGTESLLVVDNFSLVEDEKDVLADIMNLNCNVIFTTRQFIESETCFEIKAISDDDKLLEIVDCFHKVKENDKAKILKAIHAVHGHTLAVEFIGRLLGICAVSPEKILRRLRIEKIRITLQDQFRYKKDGEFKEYATFYSHLKTLFSLFRLSVDEKRMLCNLSLMPNTGIDKAMFKEVLKLKNLNAVNELVEKGLIKRNLMDQLLLDGMIREMSLADLDPSVRKCKTMFETIQEFCVDHSKDNVDYAVLFSLITSIVTQVKKDNLSFYLDWLIDVFSYMEKYDYVRGMRLILSEIERIIKTSSIWTIRHQILAYDYGAACEVDLQEMIRCEEKAVALLKKLSSEPKDVLTKTNVLNNMARYYHMIGNLEDAKKCILEARSILEKSNIFSYQVILQTCTYCDLLADIGETELALDELENMLLSTDRATIDTALIRECQGKINLKIGNDAEAAKMFKMAIDGYYEVFATNPQKMQEISNRIGSYYSPMVYSRTAMLFT